MYSEHPTLLIYIQLLILIYNLIAFTNCTCTTYICSSNLRKAPQSKLPEALYVHKSNEAVFLLLQEVFNVNIWSPLPDSFSAGYYLIQHDPPILFP